MTSTSATSSVPEAALSDLAGRIAGTVHRPGEEAYEAACAIWNAMIERRPALVVRPRNADDVAATIIFARKHDLPLSVRGGGHNIAGAALADGGVTIDMTGRRAISIDQDRRIVTVEAGAAWGEVDRATQEHGLIVPNGIVSNTGVAGLTLGGGFGWTSRKFGFTADNLLEVEVVTADGIIRRVNSDNEPALFWALRGAGVNFGVVTSFTFQAHPHGPEALCGMVVHPFERAGEVIRLFRDVTEAAPDALTCLLVLRKAPPAPFIPEAYHGQLIAAIAAHWTGPADEGEAAMRPLKEMGNPVADVIAPKPFTTFQSMLDGGQPFGRRYYWKSDAFQSLSDGLMDVLQDRAARIVSPHSAVLSMNMGGAPARVAVEDTAVGIREARNIAVFQASWEDPAEDADHIAWARTSFADIASYTGRGAYLNFLTEDETNNRLESAFHPSVYARLRTLKERYDPEHVFGGSLSL